MREYGTVSGTVKDKESDFEEFYRGYLPEEQTETDDYSVFETEEPPHDAFSYARDVVDTTIAQSDYFIESAQEQNINISNTATNAYTRHLAKITNDYLHEPANEAYFTKIDSGETYHWIKLIGNAPYAFRQQQLLDYAGDHPVDKAAVKHAKKVCTDLNETMFNLVQTNPYQTLESIAANLDLAVSSYDPDASGSMYNKMLDSTYGTRTEFACFTAVEQSSYGIRRGTSEEDRDGIDFVITPPDDADVMIDIKSSMRKINKEAGTDTTVPYAKRGERKFVYFLETSDEDFDNHTFRLTNAARIRLKRKILSDVQDMLKFE